MKLSELAWIINGAIYKHGNDLEVRLRVDNGMEFGRELDDFEVVVYGNKLLIFVDISEQDQDQED